MEQGSREKSGKRIIGARGGRIIACALSLCVAIGAAIVCVLYLANKGYGQSIDLADYTFIGWDSEGNPRGILDLDALVADLYLPSPKSESVVVEKYPDLYALCSMTMSLSYTEKKDVMQVDIDCDTDTLERYGIFIESLSWQQQVKGTVPEEDVASTPEAEATVSPSWGYKTPEPKENLMDVGYLDSLLDKQNNGINLREVCERVHLERDSLCEQYFGNKYNTVKTQVYFIVAKEPRGFYNLYRVSYRAEERVEDGSEPQTIYFTVDIYDLEWTIEETVEYGLVDVNIRSSEESSKSLAAYDSERFTLIWLYGGGQVVSGKNVFDQNGFIKFYGYPTSYMMASGVMWSPTYEALDEDAIWKLTAVDGRSLANVLRFARREIYARYYVSFSETTEAEFFAHFNQYDWYEGREPDWTDRMTEAEKENIRLLREIQDLVEN
ncbi:MAG: hypothetical protein Q4C01_05245 [Clostridia bacterium]|nr:hypothetical protein [Clostridia bacterium]